MLLKIKQAYFNPKTADNGLIDGLLTNRRGSYPNGRIIKQALFFKRLVFYLTNYYKNVLIHLSRGGVANGIGFNLS